MTQNADPRLPPFTFEPLYIDKIWGGDALARLFSRPLPSSTVGESWELSGYGEQQSVVAGGPYVGTRLEQLLQKFGSAFGGPRCDTTCFPLLYKCIDANDKLSIQVHPTDSQAIEYGWDVRGKTECWYVADAAPGATIIVGFREPVDSQTVAAAVENNTLESLLNQIPVKRGDMLFIPAGTVHAIMDGTIIYEVQETSDCTLRLYDWGRVDNNGNPRALHVEQSLKVLDFSAHNSHLVLPLIVANERSVVRSMRVACRYFAVEEVGFIGAGSVALSVRDSFQVLSVMAGSVALESQEATIQLGAGSTVLVPFSCGSVTITSAGTATVLVSWVPDLASEVIDPLRAAGHDAAAIASLGGAPHFNDLVALLPR